MTLADLSSSEAVSQALDEFDRVGREAFLQKYDFSGSIGYVVVRDGKEYDSKAIVGAAHGYEFPDEGPLGSQDFSGGTATVVPKLQSLGFEVRQLDRSIRTTGDTPALRDALSSVLKTYDAHAQTGGEALDQVVRALNATPSVAERPTLKAWRSHGMGNWPLVPWVVFPDERETESTQSGVYPVFLFSADLDGVYLALAQGVTELINEHGRREGLQLVRERAQELRLRLHTLSGADFDLTNEPDLGSGGSLARAYQASCIAFRHYAAEEMPAEANLLDELDALLTAYDRYLEPTRSWIFQANPKYYDIRNAVATLPEMNWTVNQSQNQMAAGERVYIWQSGADGGIVAVGTLLSPPALMREQEGQQFIVDSAKFEGEQLRIRLSIDRVLTEPLLRSDLLEHPVLQNLGIIRFANATNYALTSEEAEELRKMVGDYEQPISLDERVQQWRDDVGYPRARDIERKNQREPLARALSREKLAAVVEDPGRFDELSFGQFAHGAYGGPGSQSAVHTHLNTGPEAKRRLAQALEHLIYETEESEETRLDDVLLKDEWRVPGFGQSLATKALAVTNPNRWLPLFQVEGPMGKRALMRSPELRLADPGDLADMTVGRQIAWSNDELRGRLEPLIPDDPWGQAQFLYWLRDQHQEASPEESLVELADELFVDLDWLNEVFSLMEEKRQVIFQGPPGTGKTYVARRLARHMESLGGGAEIVQFHPSYAYEDFVEGFRPRLVNNQPGFELVEGPLKRLARRAEADKEHVYVLVIDELNRGNVAKVFGELYYLLEYRDDRIRLQYADEAGDAEEDDSRFALPRNLWIIATMNTADRSIALMDAALRRRFYFVDFYPNEAPVAQLLERWLRAHGNWSEFSALPSILAEANRRLGDREAAIGPSHFLLKDPSHLTSERVARIWNHAVLPYLEEQLIGEPARRDEFAFEALEQAVNTAQGRAQDPEPDAVPSEPAPDLSDLRSSGS